MSDKKIIQVMIVPERKYSRFEAALLLNDLLGDVLGMDFTIDMPERLADVRCFNPKNPEKTS